MFGPAVAFLTGAAFAFAAGILLIALVPARVPASMAT
jgi:hypothetical protein